MTIVVAQSTATVNIACSYLTWLKGRTEPSETKISAMWSLLKDTSSGSCRSRPNSTPRFTLWMVSVSRWNDLWLYSEKHQELGSAHLYYNAITDKNYNQVKRLIKNQLKIRDVWNVCLVCLFGVQLTAVKYSSQYPTRSLHPLSMWHLEATETGKENRDRKSSLHSLPGAVSNVVCTIIQTDVYILCSTILCHITK